ncbi:putative peptidase [Thalassovita autumnalis]|uniref:Peptidase n=1 Tax=Thalassovita autumnalis TaxID=2072972 RepID=A0A0N7LUQ4_9RHOB|nr:Xaa-Pro peptidase family protein [Thalassovita autumnalis]CUH64146.1 putative peptidase [Thalassovita autumnalis]CUH74474.1 putative peptidase [Thalassovita autumnalis]
MAERSLIFPRAEYERRIAALQSRMAAAGQDALLLTTAADVFYVTGFLTRFWESPARPWYMVIPATGAPVAVIPAIGADLMGRCWIEDIRVWPAPDPRDDGVSLLAQTLSDLVPEGGAIAVPMGLETQLRAPLADFACVQRRIGDRKIVDGTDTLQRVREVKSDLEVAAIRESCAIAGRVFDRVPEFARAGVPLSQVFRDFQIALLQEGADWVSYVAGGAGPGGYGDVISPADDRPLQAGDVLMLDTGAVRNGYFCDFDRNYSVGPPDAETAKAQEALWQATEVAIKELRPGRRACDVHTVLADALTDHGTQPLGGRLGHGLGVTLTEWPSFTQLDETELVAGMVLTLEPGIEIAPGRCLVHEENILLTDHGAELLSPRAPRLLPELST